MFVLSGLIGALIGATLTFGFNMWKAHRDERNARCDELCEAIWDAAILASDYWAELFRNFQEQQVKEAKLLARQSLVDGLSSDFSDYLSEDQQRLIAKNLSELIDALTGGEFSVPNRPIDTSRLQRAPLSAALAIIAIRRAYRETMPFHAFLKGYHDNRRRKIDMPAQER